MPTYQYACKECDHRFEQVQAFSDASLTECPRCHGHLRKVYGSVGVVFKGSGFYRTDSRSGASTASEPAKSESGGSSEKSANSSDSAAKSSDSSSSKSSSSSSDTKSAAVAS